MSSHFRTPIVAMALALVVVIFDVAAQAQEVRRDAREIAPEALIGTWVLNVARSTYTGGPGPKSQVRNFDYTRDGMILLHAVTVSANGNTSAHHWAVTLDGVEHPEYLRSQGSTVATLIGFKKKDERTLSITVRRLGNLMLRGEYKLSEDGNTLTHTTHNLGPDGQPTGSGRVAIFEKQH